MQLLDPALPRPALTLALAQATAASKPSTFYMSTVQDQARRIAVMETFSQFNCRNYQATPYIK